MTAGEDISELLEECLSSWNIGGAAELALRNDAVLGKLFELLRGCDDDTRVRALMAIEEVLKNLPDVKRIFLMREFFDGLMNAVRSDSDNVSLHALKVTARLVEGVPLDPETFVRLGHELKNLVKAGRNEAVLLEIPRILKNIRVLSSDPRVYDVISRFLRSRNPRLKAMGLRLLLNVSAYTGDPGLRKEVFSSIGDMLSGEDVPLADFALSILLEVAGYPLCEELIDDVTGTLTLVKNLALGGNQELREKARLVVEKLENSIYRYYKGRPEAAKMKITELLVSERFYEAADLALAVGDTYVLKWLEGVLEKMGRETLKINERVLPGPKYPSVSPEKNAHKYLKPPALSEFKRPRKSALEIALHKPSSSVGLTDEERKELERALKSGTGEEIVELSRRKPEVVFELAHKLEEGDKFERMDALWALSKLAERLDAARTIVLKTAVGPLMKITKSHNRWARLRAARALAKLASKAPYGDEIVDNFIEEYLSGKNSDVLPSLEFFSYYFSEGWDEKTARVVLAKLSDHLTGENLFDALLVLDALVSSIPLEKLHLLGPFVRTLKEVKETAPPNEQKLALRVLERIAEKSKALVTP